MKTRHRFNFPTSIKKTPVEMSMEFDLNVNARDWVTFALMPKDTWEVTQKKFTVLGDNTVESVDYIVAKVENPELP